MEKQSCGKFLFWKLLFRIFTIMVFESLSSCSKVEELCHEIIPIDYEVFKAPKNADKPLKVFIGFQVLNIGEVNEETMDYHLYLFILYAWNDTRLNLTQYAGLGKTTIMYSACKSFMWTPDIYFETAKRIETFQKTSPTTIINIFNDGSIVMSVRYSFTANCPMEFDDYPFDTQRCPFLISLMYSHDSIVILKWLDDKDSPIGDSPIQMMRTQDLLQFDLLEPMWKSNTKVIDATNHTNLIAEFAMLRRVTGCIISTFVPSILIVIMSWVTFWLRMESIPARVALSITSLLTVCTQSVQSKSQLPTINYMTAMDIWLFMCIISVFLTLLETATSYNVFSKKCDTCRSFKKINKDVIRRRYPSRFTTETTHCPLHSNKHQTFIYVTDNGSNPNLHVNTKYQKDNKCVTCFSNQKAGHRIDNISKIVFPSCFSFGSIVYASYYVHRYYNYI